MSILGFCFEIWVYIFITPIRLVVQWTFQCIMQYIIHEVVRMTVRMWTYPIRAVGKMILKAAQGMFPELASLPSDEGAKPELKDDEDKAELNEQLLLYLNSIDRLQPRNLFTQYKLNLFSKEQGNYYMSPLPFLNIIGQSDGTLEEYHSYMLDQLYLSTLGLCRLDPMYVLLKTRPARASPFSNKVALQIVKERLKSLNP